MKRLLEAKLGAEISDQEIVDEISHRDDIPVDSNTVQGSSVLYKHIQR